ncbi:unnamed protein product [Caenorhabditis brenneri]
MIIYPGKPASMIADNKKVHAACSTFGGYSCQAKMKHIQMIRPIELLDFCAVGCTPTTVFEADDSNCSSTITSSFRFNPTESDDINGAKEPLSSPGVSNAEYDTNAFGFDVKIEQVAVPFESQADQIIPNSPKESTVIHEAYCSDSSYNNATSFQISLAKEDEIEAARIRMEGYMAKRKSQMTTTIKVTSPNNMNQISQSQSDEVSGDKQLAKSGDKAPAELTEASKNNSVLDPTALSTPSVETKFAADSSNCSSKKGLRGQISPPENDEIEAARIRMEAYLAKKIGSKKN